MTKYVLAMVEIAQGPDAFAIEVRAVRSNNCSVTCNCNWWTRARDICRLWAEAHPAKPGTGSQCMMANTLAGQPSELRRRHDREHGASYQTEFHPHVVNGLCSRFMQMTL